tara:strand:- start:298 stop:1209 length:912 start_codon:yes stop_codon:yes gene_type:complete
VNEFEAITEILDVLAIPASEESFIIGPGDDGAVIRPPSGQDIVASIDTILEGVHFPRGSDPALVGYRAFMVSASDIAAMGSDPAYAIVALTLPEIELSTIRKLAEGLKEASDDCRMPIVGGNLCYGKSMSISISVHGWVPRGQELTRSGAKSGDKIFVSGFLGGAAAALERNDLANQDKKSDLDPLTQAFFKPLARLELGVSIRGQANSAIDISDGLAKDLYALCSLSGVGGELDSSKIPIATGASLDQALFGGDDYELCFTAASIPSGAEDIVSCIGKVVPSKGLWLDGEELEPNGYVHFSR